MMEKQREMVASSAPKLTGRLLRGRTYDEMPVRVAA
jgi:protein gp37